MPGSFIWTNDQSGQYCPSYSRYTQHLSSSQDNIIIIALVVIVLVSIIVGVIAYYRFIGISIVIIFLSESRFHSVNINLC